MSLEVGETYRPRFPPVYSANLGAGYSSVFHFVHFSSSSSITENCSDTFRQQLRVTVLFEDVSFMQCWVFFSSANAKLYRLLKELSLYQQIPHFWLRGNFASS